jgi:hypothetical protein
MYDDGRCGLFHLGMARRRVILRDGSPVFRITTDARRTNIKTIRIDRYRLVERIDNHLTAYVARLRDQSEAELRTNFKRAWTLVHQ